MEQGRRLAISLSCVRLVQDFMPAGWFMDQFCLRARCQQRVSGNLDCSDPWLKAGNPGGEASFPPQDLCYQAELSKPQAPLADITERNPSQPATYIVP